MKVLITRAEHAASQTAANLAKQGHEAILLPLFEVVDTQANIPDRAFDGIIFTSKNAVDILKARDWKIQNPDLPVFCVGQKTEAAAQNLGFTKTSFASGGGAALADLIGTMKLEKSKMLYLSTPDKSFDMKKALQPHNIDVETIDIYQAKPVTPENELFKRAIAAIKDGFVFTYSALSSEHFAKLLKYNKMTHSLEECTLIGISGQATKPLEHIVWKQVLTAPKPQEEEMIALMR